MNFLKAVAILPVLVFGLSVAPSTTQAAVALTKKTVEYGTTTKFEGYFVTAKNAKKNAPGILMIHNWKGITDETKTQADRFAALGYNVFAADIYGKGVRPSEAKEAARAGAKIVGAISFHGGLDSPTPADGKNIKGKVLALHGAIDPYVSPAELAAFEKEMQDSKVDYQLVKYGSAVHSFTEVGAGTDNSKGAAYNAEADRRSFAAAEDFLKEVFSNLVLLH